MTNNRRNRADEVIDEVIQCAIEHIHDERDRSSVSRVCRRWHHVDSLTRRCVTIAFCYSTTPQRLLERFPNIESLKLKGKPRASMFNLIPDNWGGYATPWLDILHLFGKLNSLHFRRITVTDNDLKTIANVKGRVLQSLKLDKCSGFSTDGLSIITRSCRDLRTLFLQESEITNNGGEWLHELALNNVVLETLNFHLTDLDNVDPADLALIAQNCPLMSLKASLGDLPNIPDLLRKANRLEEFSGVFFGEAPDPDNYPDIAFPPRLHHLGLHFTGAEEIHLAFPVANKLKSLNLMCAMLSPDDVGMLIQRCPNLEVLEILEEVLGDQGLEALSVNCKRLRKLRIERGDRVVNGELASVTPTGLIALSNGCSELEYLAVYASEISSNALASIGANLRKLKDFRLVLLENGKGIGDFPLDDGVRTLLVGCRNLRRFALYLRPGAGLTDRGLQYIGQYSENVTWMLLGHVGETDNGLRAFSRGCPKLQKLEMRGCPFSLRAFAEAAAELKRKSLRYLWIQGYQPSPMGFHELQAMTCPYWRIEIIPPLMLQDEQGVREQPAHVLAYYSLAARRNDFPRDNSVIPWP